IVDGIAAVGHDAVVGALDGAVGAGIIDRVDDGFGFSHDLIRDVVLSTVDAPTRAELHRRAAAALEPRAVADPALLTVVADHLGHAGAAHAPAAAALWDAAARHAL